MTTTEKKASPARPAITVPALRPTIRKRSSASTSITTPFTPCPPRVRNGGAAKPPSSPNLSIAGRRHGHGGSGLGAGQRFGWVVDRRSEERRVGQGGV